MKNTGSAMPTENGPYGPLVVSPQTVRLHPYGNRLLERKSLLEAYIYCFLFGLLGVHHFYLKRSFWGWMYLFSLGLLGLGWIIDLIRLPWLVAKANREEEEVFLNGYCVARQRNHRYFDLRERTVLEAYIMWFPMGIFGWHQYYLGRLGFGVAYSCSAGLGGIGWLTDFFRIPSLVRQTNENIHRLRNGEVVPASMECSLADAYQLAFPFGFLGIHHFFMGRMGRGLAYLCTGGLLGVGWLADLVRMPCLVSRHNREVRENTTWKLHLDDAYVYAIPFGILGFHRFYLSGPAVGLLYFFTAGLFVIGWLVDLVRMPCIVKAANDKQKMRSEAYCNDNNPVYVFQPHPQPQPYIPQHYGATNQLLGPQLPYPIQPGNVTYVSYNQPSQLYGPNCAVPVPSNAYVGPPPNPQPYGEALPPCPPQYETGGASQPSNLPPPYQARSDIAQSSVPTLPTEYKLGKPQA